MSTFQFMKLPLELRLMLWRFTWTDRVVIIQVGKMKILWTKPKDMSAEQWSRMEMRYMEHPWRPHQEVVHTHTPLPSTFLINCESRHETLKHYKLAFQVYGYESRIYFRHGADIPCLWWYDVTKYEGCVDLAEAKELMVKMRNDGDNYRPEYKFCMRKIIQDQWSRGVLENITSPLQFQLVMEACPKIEWLYWCDEYQCEVDPWKSRRNQKVWGM